MKNIFFIAAMALAFCCTSCSHHLISDGETRSEVHNEFELRKSHFTSGNLFAVFNETMTIEEREAMEFLYSSMTSADLADYQGGYFLENVRMALKARNEMSWGKDIPENLFLHFVLPMRINNERLDDFRKTYYDTLRKRVDGMSLHEAALEVNHWCHEHVVYVPSDARTLSPMATLVNAQGRCGEESTFAVAAMRTIGIPARQVYTPRWAHTDDNHAWVEVWVDGKWQFLGACEPEPTLNMAWFNQPASRALLMHTRVTGNYKGDEDVIKKTKCYTEINVIGTYAPIRKSMVKVLDENKKAVPGAVVEFKIYNYAEFCSVVKLTTNEHGIVTLHSGLGDMLVWASHQGKFGFGKLNSEGLTITLDHQEGDPINFAEDIVPPVQGDIPVHVTDEEIACNKERLAFEDSVRLAYVATFISPEQSAAYPEEEQTLLINARGNWKNIKAFLDGAPDDEHAYAVALLKSLPVKDLQDTSLDVLQDALKSTVHAALTPEYIRYVLCPRITNEFIQPYRTAIRSELGQDLGEQPEATAIVSWVKNHILLCDEYNPIALQGTPAGVLRMKQGDTRSRNRFFVAACRSFAIPAHMQTISGNPQYLHGKDWVEVALKDEVAEIIPKQGYLETFYDQSIVTTTPKPGYETHYTLARMENGSFKTIDIQGKRTSVKNRGGHLQQRFKLDEGYYMLTTGNRMASGKVLTQCKTFTIREGETTSVDMVIRPAHNDVGVIGNMDAEKLYLPQNATDEVSILSTTGRGYFLLAVVGSGDEPTNHALRGLASISNELKEWNRPLLILSPTPDDALKFKPELLGSVQAQRGVDIDDKVRSMLCQGCNSTSKTLPVVALCDSFGRIVYFSQGYNTSIAEQLKSVIDKL